MQLFCYLDMAKHKFRLRTIISEQFAKIILFIYTLFSLVNF